MKDYLKGFAIVGGIFVLFIIGLVFFYSDISSNREAKPVVQEATITCRTESIPHGIVEEPDDGRYISDGHSDPVGGTDGEREICVNDDTNEVVSNEITKEPESAVVYYGTLEDEPEYYYSERVGAICEDGTRSYATGRGACSWHGGVSEWLYE